jgi:hypothetical protein
VCSEHSTPSAVSPLKFFVYYSFFILLLLLWWWWWFLQGRSQSVQGAMLVYPRGSCGNTVCLLFAHLFFCISQAGLELASGSVGPLLFSQCNMAWRSCVMAGGSGSQSFDSLWWFFSCQVWFQSLSKIFDLWSSCCLLLHSNHHLGSLNLSVFSSGRNIHVSENRPVVLNWRDTCVCWKNSIDYTSWSVLHKASLWELCLYVVSIILSVLLMVAL